MNAPDPSCFVALERRVWQLLADSYAGADAVLLSYRATFGRPDIAKAAAPQIFLVSSIRKLRGASRVSVFRQDMVPLPATTPPGMEVA